MRSSSRRAVAPTTSPEGAEGAFGATGALGAGDPCAKCGRTLLEVRSEVGRDALRGTAPLCPIPACPLVARVSGFATLPVAARGRELFGPSPPAVFVGRFGYPRVAVGPLLPPVPVDDPALAADTRALAGLDIAGVLAVRSQLVRSKASMDVRRPLDEARALEASRALAMAEKPVETEVTLAKPLKADFAPRLDAYSMPMGPSVDVVKSRVTENPSVPRKVDALVSDVHADAATAVTEMYAGGVAVDQIQRLLSVGLLGERDRRRLVPTRWSITATDDVLSKDLLATAKTFSPIDAIEHYHSSLFGNHFEVLLLPRTWAFEMVEAWWEAGAWKAGRDFEGYAGRTDYASNVTGAYYAARLGVLEQLLARRRQAAALVYREITEDYWAPLGVWVIREAVRAAMQTKPLVFGEFEAAARHVTRRARNKEWRAHAGATAGAASQRRLDEF